MKRFEKLCNEYRENKRLIEELEALNDSIKANILLIMGDAETMTEGAAKATFKTVTSSRLDSSAIKKELPEVFQQYYRADFFSPIFTSTPAAFVYNLFKIKRPAAFCFAQLVGLAERCRAFLVCWCWCIVSRLCSWYRVGLCASF